MTINIPLPSALPSAPFVVPALPMQASPVSDLSPRLDPDDFVNDAMSMLFSVPRQTVAHVWRLVVAILAGDGLAPNISVRTFYRRAARLRALYEPVRGAHLGGSSDDWDEFEFEPYGLEDDHLQPLGSLG